jgi:hypothetical protein
VNKLGAPAFPAARHFARLPYCVDPPTFAVAATPTDSVWIVREQLENNEAHELLKRRRFRFSIRTMLIVVGVLSLYLGCWFPAATSGVRDVNSRYSTRTAAKAPLLLVRDVYESLVQRNSGVPVIVRRAWHDARFP